MKTSIATTLSIAGVLVAGAAAFAVNTSVLGAAADADTVGIVSTSTPGSGSTPVSVPGVSSSGGTATVTARSSSVDGTTTTYRVGTAGSVVIDTSSGSVVVTSILPAAGFTSEPARTDRNGAVKVHFVSDTQRIEFMARMLNGAVVTEVTNESVQMAPPSTYDDDDRYEDDDDDDDHHEDRDDHDDEDHEDEDDD